LSRVPPASRPVAAPWRWATATRSRRAAVALAVAVALVIVVVIALRGGREPTVTQAGDQLQQAAQRLYAQRLGRGTPTVSNGATIDQPCTDRRARRVYTATIASAGFQEQDPAFNFSIALMSKLGPGWQRQSTRNSSDTVSAVGVDGHARLSVRTSQDGKSYTVSGQTDCLLVS
jgi:hypothetical protein